MQDLFIYVGLFFVLQTRVSSDQGVSLGCNDTVGVQFGESVTVNCSILLKKNQSDFHVWLYTFESNNVEICNSTLPDSRCKSDNLTYVSLTISEILHEEKIDVYLTATCGHDHRSITVVPYAGQSTTKDRSRSMLSPGEPSHVRNSNAEDESRSKTPVIILVAVLIGVVIVVYLMYRKQTNRSSHLHSDLEKMKGRESDVQQSLNTEEENGI